MGVLWKGVVEEVLRPWGTKRISREREEKQDMLTGFRGRDGDGVTKTALWSQQSNVLYPTHTQTRGQNYQSQG